MQKKNVVGLEGLSGLTSLSICDRSISKLPPGVTRLTRLESLCLTYCHGIKSLQPLADLPSLTALEVSGLSRLDVATIPPRVTSLSISETDVPMAVLYSAVGGTLTSLDMRNCEDQTGHRMGVPGIGMFRWTLKNLAISGLYDLFRRDLVEIGTLHQLETLDLSDCGHFQHDDLTSIEGFGNLSALKSLNLVGTCIVSLPEDVGVLARLVGLESLKIDGPASDVEALRATLPRLMG
jgi:Leucine-rich repeat (LRR) protein